jgi:hypothetical protein
VSSASMGLTITLVVVKFAGCLSSCWQSGELLTHHTKAKPTCVNESGLQVGLSKLARLVDVFSKRLQIQERLTDQIAQALQVCILAVICLRFHAGAQTGMFEASWRCRPGRMRVSATHSGWPLAGCAFSAHCIAFSALCGCLCGAGTCACPCEACPNPARLQRPWHSRAHLRTPQQRALAPLLLQAQRQLLLMGEVLVQ